MKIKYEYRSVIIAVLLAVSATFSGCSTYNDTNNVIFSEYGIAYTYDQGGGAADYFLINDDGVRLYIESNLWPEEKFENGDRVKFNYEVTKGKNRPESSLPVWMEKDITLYFISEVRTEKPIMESFIAENERHRRDSIGNDPLVDITRMFFSGGYLNVEYRVYTNVTDENAKNKHYMVNLVVDDVNSTDELITLRLCYNAKGELPAISTDSRYEVRESEVSFNVESLVPEGQNQIVVKFIWNEQQTGERSRIKTYYPQ